MIRLSAFRYWLVNKKKILRSEQFIGSIASLQYCFAALRSATQNFRLAALLKNENGCGSLLRNWNTDKSFEAW